MINGINYEYYWQNPDEYPRLTMNDLQNEPTLELMEFVLEGLREEIDDIKNSLIKKPFDKDYQAKARVMLRCLNTKYYESITYGNNKTLMNEIISVLPKEVKETWTSEKECTPGESKTIKHSKAFLSRRA